MTSSNNGKPQFGLAAGVAAAQSGLNVPSRLNGDQASYNGGKVSSVTQSQREEPRHLTTAEAAFYLRLSPRTLERYRVEGTGPQYVRAGRGMRARVFYLSDDLDAWLKGQRFMSTSEYNGG